MRVAGVLLIVLSLTNSPESQRPGTSYLLPFPPGDSLRLIQGPGGPWGHVDALAHAYDFVMPIGSPVVASRGGTVVATEGRFNDGTREPGQENFVFIAHGDSTFARYYHLTTGGPSVRVGDVVRAGQVIGRSGNSGASAGPHLHFDVTRGCAEWGCPTVPIAFVNAGADSLVQGRWYTARSRVP